ncbi:MAG TPA: hypothetical protein VHC97_28500 [Thermoanaerobaculia bacterium]|jgi:hypothetical protein|nr:hypothetical protein [Thermoanaerobaculia bacterium]
MHLKKLARVLLIGMVAFSVAGYLESGSPDTENAEPLTNQAVIKLSKEGVNEAAIIQKINQAVEVNFLVDAASLASLQSEGVSQNVIAAMTRKASIQARETAIRNYQARTPKLTVELETPTGTIGLKGLDGYKSEARVSRSLLFSTTFALKGAKAEHSISFSRPTILITTVGPLEDASTFFLVRLNSQKDERLYKMGSIKQVGGSNVLGDVPSEGSQVKFDANHQSTLVWRLTPKEDLKPGEYAVMVYAYEEQGWKIFDFSVN